MPSFRSVRIAVTSASRTVATSFCLLSVSLVFIDEAKGQKNFEPGYVILHNDTVRGFVDYRNWADTPDKISFKRDLDASATVYRPLDIAGFAVRDEFYESAIVETETSRDRTSIAVATDEALQLETDTAFLQTMIAGPKSLYFYENRVRKAQFYIKQGGAHELLVYKEFLTLRDGSDGFVENNKYRQQLMYYLGDCRSIQPRLERAQYTKTSLENVFLYYFDCVNDEPDFQKKTERGVLDFGVMAGVSIASLTIRGDTELAEMDFDAPPALMAGAYLEFTPPRNLKKWSVYNEFGFATYESTGEFTETMTEGYYTVYRATIGMSYIRMVNMVRFKLPLGAFAIFANAGISNGMAIGETNMLATRRVYFTNEYSDAGPALPEIRKYEQGYVVGLGATFGHFSLAARYERTNGMSPFAALATHVRRTALLLSFKI